MRRDDVWVTVSITGKLSVKASVKVTGRVKVSITG